ncbi:hypothetical protein EM4838_03100 [Enterococcus mundtii]|nr:hypothetical protein EM4838_03100 [Enterococcus mundtii]
MDFRQSKKQQVFEEEITRTKIDADLKAKARIKWIGEVRQKSSELISLFLSLQKKKIDFYEQWLKIEEASELLKLYFNSIKSPEAVEGIYISNTVIKISDNIESILLNSSTNENKNSYIRKYVELLVELYKDNKYQENAKYKEMYNNYLDEAYEKMFYFNLKYDDSKLKEILAKPEGNLNDDEHEYKSIKTSIDSYDERLKKIEEELRGYQQAIDYFSKIIALYLKIEWDKAKQGK